MTRFVDGLREIAGAFDGCLIDQFGVIHDGRTLYPEARAALEALKEAGKPVAILTNSGKRRAANHARITAMGVPADLFTDVVSSGDVAHGLAASGALGRVTRAAIIGKHGEDYGFNDLPVAFVDAPETADVLFILGSDAPRTSLADYAAILAPAARAGVPAVCCNPDRAMLTSQGLQPAPGAIAALYEDLGGAVTWIGKPHALIYEKALTLLGALPPGRVLAVGDSLEHDVRGGAGLGLATALVRTGIASELDAEAIASASPAPDFVLPSLRW